MRHGDTLAAALLLTALAASAALAHPPGLHSSPAARDGVDPGQRFPYAVLSGAGGHFHALAVSPGTGPMLAGTHLGLFRSDDRGANWRLLDRRFGGVAIRAVVREPRSGALYVATRELGLVESRDGGRQWRTLGEALPGRAVRALAVDPSNPRVLYAWVAGRGLVRTEDGGTRWSRLANPGPLPEVVGLAVHPTVRTRLYAATDQGVWVGEETGRSWRLPPDGLRRPTGSVAVPLWDPGVVLAATADGAFATRADGTGWRALPAHPAWWGPLTAFAFRADRPGVVFTVSHEGVVIECPLEGGGAWTPVAAGAATPG